MKYQLSDGNVIVADADFIAQNYPDAVLVEEPEAVEPEAPAITEISRHAFRSRFTAEEKASLEIAMLDDPSAPLEQRQQAALIRAFDKDLSAAEVVDLEYPQTVDGVNMLEQSGLIGPGRAAEILTP